MAGLFGEVCRENAIPVVRGHGSALGLIKGGGLEPLSLGHQRARSQDDAVELVDRQRCQAQLGNVGDGGVEAPENVAYIFGLMIATQHRTPPPYFIVANKRSIHKQARGSHGESSVRPSS